MCVSDTAERRVSQHLVRWPEGKGAKCDLKALRIWFAIAMPTNTSRPEFANLCFQFQLLLTSLIDMTLRGMRHGTVIEVVTNVADVCIESEGTDEFNQAS